MFSERSADGNVLSWKGKTAKGDLTTLATFTYDPLQAAIQSRHTVTGANDSQQIVATDQHSPWLDSHQRQVCSDQILSAGFYYSLLGANYVTQYPTTVRSGLARSTRAAHTVQPTIWIIAIATTHSVVLASRRADLQTGHTLMSVMDLMGSAKRPAAPTGLMAAKLKNTNSSGHSAANSSRKWSHARAKSA